MTPGGFVGLLWHPSSLPRLRDGPPPARREVRRDSDGLRRVWRLPRTSRSRPSLLPSTQPVHMPMSRRMRRDDAQVLRVRPIRSAAFSAVGGAAIVGLSTVVLLVVIGVENKTVSYAIVGAVAGTVFVTITLRACVDVSHEGIVVRNGFSTHKVAWQEIGALRSSYFHPSPSIVMPGYSLLVVATKSGRRVGIDASPGSDERILDAFARYAPGGSSQIGHLLRR